MGLGRIPWVLMATATPATQDGSLQCPTCKAIYGEKTGTQPPGKMEFHLIPHSLPGFADTQTIRIVYDIPTGIQVSVPARPHSHPCPGAETLLPLPTPAHPQGPEHPNPGKKFTARGFPRHCYLPNNEKGRKVSAWPGGCGNQTQIGTAWAPGPLSPRSLPFPTAVSTWAGTPSPVPSPQAGVLLLAPP